MEAIVGATPLTAASHSEGVRRTTEESLHLAFQTNAQILPLHFVPGQDDSLVDLASEAVPARLLCRESF